MFFVETHQFTQMQCQSVEHPGEPQIQGTSNTHTEMWWQKETIKK